jgi:uncharacterized protein (DUF1800 family)
MIMSTRVKNQHLLWRAAFGPMSENVASLDDFSQNKLWTLLLKSSSKTPEKIVVVRQVEDSLDYVMQDMAMLSAADKEAAGRTKRQQSRDELKTLNVLWLQEMVNGEAQLREKMSFFWHGHFACRVNSSFFQQEMLHIIRTGALGNFGELLKAVSKAPSMLQFLNNQQNRKGKPNENFAREVMELFTMGRGNYSENDVKEAARAFTGWGFNFKGEFVFRNQYHDSGVKTILGKTGNFNGDDVLDILLAQPQTAVFLTKKIYRFFVNETPDEKNILWLSTRFFDNKYDIQKLLEDIFTSNWFYAPKNIGNKIKSPVELIAGIRRFLPLELDNDQSQLLFQKVLGQTLFYPPNVAGWPGGRTWIDSSTLMVRLQIPQVLASKESINIRAKNDDDVNMGQMMEEQQRALKNKMYTSKGGAAKIDWETVFKTYEQVERKELAQKISDTVLQSQSRIKKELLSTYIAADSRENFIKTTIIQLMSTPEYQLC